MRGLWIICVPVVLLLALSEGCNYGGGESDYARAQQSRQSARDKVIALGAEVEEKEFRVAGKALKVSVHGHVEPQLFPLVEEMGNVLELDLSKSDITDEQLKDLPPRIRVLDLQDTAITDAGLQILKEKKGIAGLHLEGTKVTDAGVKDYEKATTIRLPVEFGSRPIPREITH